MQSGQLVKRLWIKCDSGVVCIISLNIQFQQLCFTWQLILEDPALEFDVLQPAVGPAKHSIACLVLQVCAAML